MQVLWLPEVSELRWVQAVEGGVVNEVAERVLLWACAALILWAVLRMVAVAVLPLFG